MPTNQLKKILPKLSQLDEDDGLLVYGWVTRSKSLVDAVFVSLALFYLALRGFFSKQWTPVEVCVDAGAIAVLLVLYRILQAPLTTARQVLRSSDYVTADVSRSSKIQARILYWLIVLAAFLVSGLLDFSHLS